MAPKTKLIGGTDNVRRVFRTLPEAAARNIAHALNLSADEVVRDAKILVGYDNSSSQEHVRETIDRTEIRAVAAHRAGNRNLSGNAKVIIYAGDTKQTADAAFRQEYGRKPGGTTKTGKPMKHKGHNPTEFMNLAFHKNKQRLKGRISRAIKAAAREAASRGR